MADSIELIRPNREGVEGISGVALRLGPHVSHRIREHAAGTYPDECCGALIGRKASVDRVLPLSNMTEQGPRRRFLVRPVDYQTAEVEAASDGSELLGFYHSHPDAPARPSPYDLEHAWPSFFYVIVAVPAGRPAEATCWQLKEDRSMFEARLLDEGIGTNAESEKGSAATGSRPCRTEF